MPASPSDSATEFVQAPASSLAVTPGEVSSATGLAQLASHSLTESGFYGEDIYVAFARFLQIEVADGDATEDTVSAYYREVALWVQWCISQGVQPENAKRFHIEAYREDLKRRGMAVATRAHKISIVRRFYEAALRAGLRDNNPAAGVRGGRDFTPPEEKIRVLTEGALDKVISAVPGNTLDGKRDRLMLAMMAIHGLRRVEVHRIDHEHLDLMDDSPTVRVQGKGHKQRTIPMRSDVARALMIYIEAKQKASLPLQGSLFVAHGNRSRGQRLSRRSINILADKYLRETGLKRTGQSCHVFRHTHATEALRNGAKLEHVRDGLGHADVKMTMVYIHLLDRLKNSPANFITVGLKFEEEDQTVITQENYPDPFDTNDESSDGPNRVDLRSIQI